MIYIVEDDSSVLELELYALRQAGYEVQGFSEGGAFREALREHTPSLVMLDVMLPGEDGMSLLRWMRTQDRLRQVPIIMVTAKGSELDKVQGLDSGADDYLTKPFGVMELLARIRALIRRTAPSEQESYQLGLIRLDCGSHRVFVDGQLVSLTHMEFELLRFLMAHAGQAVTRELLLDDVWGLSYAGDTRTVDVHIRTLRQKLGAAGDQIATVRGVGYRMEDKADA